MSAASCTTATSASAATVIPGASGMWPSPGGEGVTLPGPGPQGPAYRGDHLGFGGKDEAQVASRHRQQSRCEHGHIVVRGLRSRGTQHALVTQTVEVTLVPLDRLPERLEAMLDG